MITSLLIAATLSTPPLGFSLRPPSLELDPAPKPVECAADMTTFEPSPVPFDDVHIIPYRIEGERQPQHWKVRPGVLLSECGFVGVINTRASAKRLRLEVESLWNLVYARDTAWEKAETNYQDTIVKMMDDLRAANTPSFWEEWDGAIMFGIGILVTAGAVAGTAAIIKALSSAQAAAMATL